MAELLKREGFYSFMTPTIYRLNDLTSLKTRSTKSIQSIVNIPLHFEDHRAAVFSTPNLEMRKGSFVLVFIAFYGNDFYFL